MKNYTHKSEKWLQNFLFVLSTTMCILFIYLGLNHAIERGHRLYYLIITPAILCIVCAGIFQLNITKNKYVDIFFLFLLAFLPRFFLASSTWAMPTNDFEFYYRTALELANGNLELIRSSTYTVSYPFLQAFVVFQSFLIKSFGGEITILRLIYSIITSFTCILIYLIGVRYDRRVGLFAGIMSALYISNIVFSSVLTCQHISTFLYYLAFYIFTMEVNSNKKRLIKYFLTGFVLGLANLMRAIAPPILLAIVFFCLFKGFFCNKNEIVNKLQSKIRVDLKIGYTLLLLIVLFSGYLITEKSFDYYAYHKGYRDEMSIRTSIGFKFMVGLNYEGSGYSNSEMRAMYSSADKKEKKQLLKSLFINHLKNPNVFINKVVLKKLTNQWSGIDASYRWLYGDELNEIKQKTINGEASEALKARYEKCYMMQHFYNYIDYSYQIVIMFLAAIGFWTCRKIKSNNTLTLYTWIILGYVAIHILIEAQQRYRYFGMPIFFLFAAIGMVYIVEIIKKRIGEYK